MASRLPTTGAVPVINEKGKLSMEKVKVQRYKTGVRPVFVSDKKEEVSLS
jgi:microfibrillar-associated protein 1